MNKTPAFSLSPTRLVFASCAIGMMAIAIPACGDSGNDGSADGAGGTGGTADGSAPIAAYCEPADTCPVDVTGADLETPVSFASDVMPIFQTSCNDGLCHGDRTRARADLWLGPEEGEVSADDLETIVDTLTGKTSELNGDLRNVVPSDWESSFLMHKVDGCQNDLGLECDEAELDTSAVCEEPCGDGMPQDDDLYPLTDAQRNTIRAWIAQGAENN